MTHTITMSGSSLTGSEPNIDAGTHDYQACQRYAGPNDTII